jgi:5-formyltetrahydrofolate cyclo-ligase
MSTPGDIPRTSRPGKAEWRRRLLRARRAVPDEVWAAEAELLVEAVVDAARDAEGPVCCYAPIRDEPGSLAMLDALRADGHEVLLPVVPVDRSGRAARPEPMSWAPYRGVDALRTGPYGLHQPEGPDWGPAALASAGLVLVPALAVDRRGVRLGRGGGWYDRSLPLARPTVPLVAVVRDEEVVDALPMGPHDVLMTAVITPNLGLRALPLRLD